MPLRLKPAGEMIWTNRATNISRDKASMAMIYHESARCASRHLGRDRMPFQLPSFRDLVSLSAQYAKLHWIRLVMLMGGVATLTVLILFRSYFVREILAYAQRHPFVSRVLHAAMEAIPDIAFALLAIAGLGYLWPELIGKLGRSRATRLIAAIIFAAFGLAAVVVNSINREIQENQQKVDRDKIDNLTGQVHDSLQFLVQSKGIPNELERRKQILDTLRSEYILSHPKDSAAIIAGTISPPAEWVNERLKQLGEQWPYLPPKSVKPVSVQRSYVAWVDMPRFAVGEHENDPLAVGRSIGFNIGYKQSGPNAVDILGINRWLYFKRDAEIETQNALVEDFKSKVAADRDRELGEPETLQPGASGHFFSAVAVTETGRYYLATQADLDDLKTGKAFVFIVALVTYRDPSSSKTERHLQLCEYLQPPANPPGIWHYCEAGYNRAD